MSNIDEKFVNLNKDLQDIGHYAMACQRITAWHEVYFKLHQQLNLTQHDWVRLQTDKEIGIDIDQLRKEHNELKKQLFNEDKDNGKTTN